MSAGSLGLGNKGIAVSRYVNTDLITGILHLLFGSINRLMVGASSSGRSTTWTPASLSDSTLLFAEPLPLSMMLEAWENAYLRVPKPCHEDDEGLGKLPSPYTVAASSSWGPPHLAEDGNPFSVRILLKKGQDFAEGRAGHGLGPYMDHRGHAEARLMRAQVLWPTGLRL